MSGKYHTAGEKLVRVRGIVSSHPICLVKCKLFVYYTMIVFVKPLILGNLFPQTMAIIVIGNSIFIAISP